MSLMEQIRNDLKTAMKAREAQRVGTLRMLLADVKRKEIDGGITVDDTELIKILKGAVKSRADSVEAYEKGNRPDLAEKEKMEMAILQVYLPAELSTEELEKIVRAAIAETGAESPRDMGTVMKTVMATHGDRVDGRTLSGLVKQLLS